MPSSFFIEFGEQLPSKVKVKCNKLTWKAKIDSDSARIHGLRKFMHFYGIKLLHLVQFDYQGGDIFIVKIFKDYAIECNYPKRTHFEFMKNGDRGNCREDQYMVNVKSLEFEKAYALWSFNALRNCVHYSELVIDMVDLDYRRHHLVSSKYI